MPTRRTYSHAFPNFVADPHSMDHLGSGALVDFAAFPAGAVYGEAGKKVIPAGTRVERDATTKKLIPLAAGRPLLLITDAVEGSRVAALSGYGAYTGGNVYAELLPGTLTAGERTALAPFFLLQPYGDVRG